MDVLRTNDGTVAKLIVKFKNENVGKQNRKDNLVIASKYPTETVIEKVSFSYTLSKKVNCRIRQTHSDSVSSKSGSSNNSSQNPRPNNTATT